jgi:hypothetical protein
VVWFVLDTGMSLALGFPLHALFNVPFALALAIPLIKLRSAESAGVGCHYGGGDKQPGR